MRWMTPWQGLHSDCKSGQRVWARWASVCRCKEISSYARAQELLRQGHTYLDSNSDGEACESLR